jgi:hypothetical protein
VYALTPNSIFGAPDACAPMSGCAPKSSLKFGSTCPV